MRRIIYYFGLLLVSGMVSAQSGTENYIQTRTYLEPVTTSSASAKQIHTVQYLDGLGRPIQVVNVKASPLGKDVVLKIEYDQFGRQVKDYLPLPQSGTQNGTIYTSPLNNAPSVYGAEKIYAEKILENSPLDRILQQKQVGTDWNTHPVMFGYDTNNGTEVKKYGTTTTWNNNATLSGVFISPDNGGKYPANQLYKNSVTDEDGNVSIEFKNGQGQTVLVRKHDGSQNVDTYYVYNEYDQLAFVISPLAAAKMVLTSTDLDELCYQYRYDGRNRLVEKKLPGKGWEWMVYDKADRLVFTQDANLRTAGKWFFTKYDSFGRPIYTGTVGGDGRSDMQTMIGNLTISESRQTVAFSKNGLMIYYSNVYFDYLDTVLSVNYYDTYPAGTPTIPTTILSQAVLPQDAQNSSISTKSLPTASYVKNIEDDNWTKNYFWYDARGRAIGSHSINHLGGYTKTESALDFAGAVQQNKTYHKRTAADTERIISESFTYDPQNRLLSQSHQVDTNPVEMLAVNIYNELSQLKEKSVGGGLQTVNYTYNIRGWMTKINDPSALGSDLFGYKIKYNQVEGLETPNIDYMNLQVKPKYNGNIAEVDWKTSTDPNNYYRRYGYVYDALNRLRAGFYQLDTNPSAKEYFEKLDYDANGNILALKRSAELSSSGFASSIDELSYVYVGNKLTSVTDSSTDYRGYPDTSGSTITYDTNGNMKNHVDKGILQIDYNFLNLPDYIKFNQSVPGRGGDIYVNTRYLYRADGAKLRKVYTYKDGASLFMATKETEYLDGFQYESLTSIFSPTTIAQLRFIPTAEGYYNFENNQYIYNYVDHLGNTRLSYFRNGSSAEVLEENNYYPFGLKHEGYNDLMGNEKYQYKYNGKELQTESGMYDYGARFYMPDIGRWGVVDPRSQGTHETYSYVWNNPIFFNDPTGMTGEPCEGCPKPDPPIRTTDIQEVVITVYRPILVKPASIDISATSVLSGIAAMRSPNPYAIGAAMLSTIIIYNMPKINMPIGGYRAEQIIYNPDHPGQFLKDYAGDDTDDNADINGVPVPIDDSGIKKPDDNLIGGNKFDFAQRGKNNGKATDIELLRKKKQDGTLSKLEQQKLKKHEKNTGERPSRQSKDKK